MNHTATDYYQEALPFTTVNAGLNGLAAPAVRLIDWRHLPDDLGRFDLVAASDVLYERGNCELVSAALARTLRAGGLGLVTDPGRSAAADFAERCRARGLEVYHAPCVQAAHDGLRETIDLYEIRPPL